MKPNAGERPPAADRPVRLVVHIDGASKGNPGPAGAAAVFEDEDGRPAGKVHRFLGRRTNNEAEYAALLIALEEALRRGARSLDVVSDSELLVRQLEGTYKVRHPGLLPLYQEAQTRIRKLARFSARHVPREQNREADRLANEAIRESSSST